MDEWINEILTVPIYYLAKLQPRDLGRSMGKGGPVELDSPFKVEHFWCKIGRIKQITVTTLVMTPPYVSAELQ